LAVIELRSPELREFAESTMAAIGQDVGAFFARRHFSSVRRKPV